MSSNIIDILKNSLLFLKNNKDNMINDLIEVCKIPALTFLENKRCMYIKRIINEIGIKNAYIDGEGNLLWKIEGRENGVKVLLSAHADEICINKNIRRGFNFIF